MKNAPKNRELYEIKGASKEQLEAENSKIADVKIQNKCASTNQKDAKIRFHIPPLPRRINWYFVPSFCKYRRTGNVAGQPIAKLPHLQWRFLKLNVPSNLDIKGIYYNKSFEVTSFEQHL